MIPLRPYQLDGVEAVRARIAAGKRRIVFVLSTGGGKTVVASAIVDSAHRKGSRVLFVAHRRELIRQTFTKLLRNGLPVEQVGIVMAGVPARSRALFGEDPLVVLERMRAGQGATDPQIDSELWGLFGARRPQAPIQVASIDTARGKNLLPPDLIIIDECHRALAKSYRDLVAAYPNAVVLGLTATPYRADGKGLGELFEDIVPIASPRQLVELGFLVEPRMFTVPKESLPDLSKVHVSGGDYNAEELSDAIEENRRRVGDIVEHWQRRAEGARTVCFAADVKDSRKIVDAFQAAGVRAEHLDGETPTGERDAILSRLERGETRVVSNCGVLCEGWDMPVVACAILARPTKSEGLYLQQAGRILRPHPEKPWALILDHAGVIREHNGGPIADRDFDLGPPKKRKGVSEEPPRVKTCPQCFALVPAQVRTCPEYLHSGEPCLYAFGEAGSREGPEEEDGELVEHKDASRDEKRAAFDRLCAERGNRKPRWVYREFLDLFGVKPPKAWKVPLREDELDVNDGAKVQAWRSYYREAFARNAGHSAECFRFRERFGHWPSRALLAERDAFVKRERERQRLAEEEAQVAAWAGGDAKRAALSPLEQQIGASLRPPPVIAPAPRRVRLPPPNLSPDVYAPREVHPV